jgi:hypothetical protein
MPLKAFAMIANLQGRLSSQGKGSERRRRRRSNLILTICEKK